MPNYVASFKDGTVDALIHRGIEGTVEKKSTSSKPESDKYASVITLSDIDISHYGVKGMKWGVRNDAPGSKLATHRATVDAKHLARDKPLPTKGLRVRKGLVTDFTLSPYRSAGRLRRSQGRSPFSPLKGIKFENLTGKQQSKLMKSLARDLSKLKEKQLPKDKRGQTDYLKLVKSDPRLRDSLVRQHAGLMKFAHRNKAMGESRKKYLVTQTNWPRMLPYLNAAGAKTGLAVGTLGISALATRAISRHGSDISELDYVGTEAKTGIAHFTLSPSGDADPKGLMHYGVKGMRWGIRNDNDGSPRPTLARAREVRRIAKADQIDAIRASRPSIAAGQTSVVRNGKILSTKQALKSVDKQAEKLAKRNPIAQQREEARKFAHEEEKQKTLAEVEHSVAKFNRLEAQMKTHGLHSLQDDELKFVNSRNEALAKAQAAYTKPKSWLRTTLTNHAKKIASEELLGLMTAGFAAAKGKGVAEGKSAKAKLDAAKNAKNTKPAAGPSTPKPKIASNRKFDRSKYSSSSSSFTPGTTGSYTRGGPGTFSTSTALVRAAPLQNYAPRTGTTATGVPIFNVTSLR